MNRDPARSSFLKFDATINVARVRKQSAKLTAALKRIVKEGRLNRNTRRAMRAAQRKAAT
jgi:hypothetical protein